MKLATSIIAVGSAQLHKDFLKMRCAVSKPSVEPLQNMAMSLISCDRLKTLPGIAEFANVISKIRQVT